MKLSQKDRRDLAWDVNQIRNDAKALLEVLADPNKSDARKLGLAEVVAVSALHMAQDLLVKIDPETYQ